jgi:hypothetical protein
MNAQSMAAFCCLAWKMKKKLKRNFMHIIILDFSAGEVRPMQQLHLTEVIHGHVLISRMPFD